MVATDEVYGKTDVMVASYRNPCSLDSCRSATVALPPGDALVLDGRTLHRGLKTGSDSTKRTMCFCTYKLRSFEDGNASLYLGGDSSDRFQLVT